MIYDPTSLLLSTPESAVPILRALIGADQRFDADTKARMQRRLDRRVPHVPDLPVVDLATLIHRRSLAQGARPVEPGSELDIAVHALVRLNAVDALAVARSILDTLAERMHLGPEPT